MIFILGQYSVTGPFFSPIRFSVFYFLSNVFCFRFMQDAYLLWVCYVVLFFLATFCAIALPLYPASSTAKVAAEGTWQVVFVVFLAYAMMPLKSYIAAVFGFLLCGAHLAIASLFSTEFHDLMWQQVRKFQRYQFTDSLLAFNTPLKKSFVISSLSNPTLLERAVMVIRIHIIRLYNYFYGLMNFSGEIPYK